MPAPVPGMTPRSARSQSVHAESCIGAKPAAATSSSPSPMPMPIPKSTGYKRDSASFGFHVINKVGVGASEDEHRAGAELLQERAREDRARGERNGQRVARQLIGAA